MASRTFLCFNSGKRFLPFTTTKFIPSSKRPLKNLSFSSISCSLNIPQPTLEPKSQLGSPPNVVKILEERGLLESLTSENLRLACSDQTTGPLKVYRGFDPTAESLHLGNLLGLIVLSWFQKCGHKAVALIGGATGRIGDPSGKSKKDLNLIWKHWKITLLGLWIL
ncbi:hypothetical protein CRYUN_Cryun38cG0031200 [Craigia yunnanensis]